MSIVNALKEVQSFFEKEVCAGLTFKRPPSVEGKDTRDYEYELVNPKAFIMYPPNDEKFPSVTIQVDEGETSRTDKKGGIKLRLLFATWSNGKHYTDEGNVPNFEPNSEGWLDAWNFLDCAIDVLNRTTYLGEHVRIKHEDGIKYGGMKEDNVLANYYPYWFAWLNCTVEYGETNSDSDVNELI